MIGEGNLYLNYFVRYSAITGTWQVDECKVVTFGSCLLLLISPFDLRASFVFDSK